MNTISEFNLTPEIIESFIENTPIAYIILDEDRRIHYINKSFLKLRHLDWSTTMGEYCYNISNNGTPCDNCAVENALKQNKPDFVTRRDTLPDGSIKYIDDYAIPLTNISNDEHQYILEIMINRSDEMTFIEKRNEDFDNLVGIMSDLLETKDTYTAEHSNNVHTIAYHISRAMNLSDEQVFNISLAAKLHDIGKVNIPNSIINKPSKLTHDEFEIIKSHPAVSYNILKELDNFKEIAEIVLHHHERIDGKGYPDGLKNDEISIGAKIVAVADTFEAMTSDRSYRKALSPEVALKEMRRVSGTQLDAEVVRVFEELNFNYQTYEPAEFNRHSNPQTTINRILSQNEISTDKSNWSRPIFNSIDKNIILKEIFENTPCGYVLMKPDYTVIYASPYFLNYMGLKKEDVLGNRCYTIGKNSGSPCETCSAHTSIRTSSPSKILRKQETKNGTKFFDMYTIPLLSSDNKLEYIIEVTLDRTTEKTLEQSRLNDYKSLFNILTELIEQKGTEEQDQEMLSKIPEFKQKLDFLFN